MRFRPASRAVIAGASLVATWAYLGQPVQADILVGSTLIPTSSVVTSSSYLPMSTVISSPTYLPTSSVIATSAYLPTSYVVPTSAYLPTSSFVETGGSYYLPTSGYVTTSYRRRLFQPRRFVERTSYYASPTSYLYASPTSYFASPSIVPTTYLSSSLLPTSYVVPTTSYLPTTYVTRSALSPTSYLVDDGLIATTAMSSGSACCDSSPVTMAPPADPTPTRSVAPRPASPAAPGPDGSITSQPRSNSTTAPSNDRTPSAEVRQNAADEGTSSNVYPPMIETPAPAVPPKPKPVPSSPPEPAPPSESIGVPAPGTIGGEPKTTQTDDQINRTAYRPAYYTTRPGGRNVLRGRVVSFESGQPEEAVSVVLTHRAGTFDDRKTITNADGEFKISLPDGDWAVKVTMPSGKVFTFARSMTASAGQVVDPNGNAGELIIKR